MQTALKPEGARFYWPAALFLVAVHICGVFGVWWMITHWCWPTVFLALGMYTASGLPITYGYHRFFAHEGLKVHPVVKNLHLIMATAAFGGSALKWSASHRLHHQCTDTRRDPYNAQLGFWWSHIGWVYHTNPETEAMNGVDDLREDPWIMWQHKWFYAIAFVTAIVIPCGLAACWGDLMGGFLVAFGLRLTLLLHDMFSVNSIAHTFGKQTYSHRISPRDNAPATYAAWAGVVTFVVLMFYGYVLVGLAGTLAIFNFVALGELFSHSRHHRFPKECFNGQWLDPTGWCIYVCSKIGLAWDLHRTKPEEVERVRLAEMET